MFDIGVNLTSSQFAKDRDDVVARAFAAGVKGMLLTGTNIHESQQALKLARRYPHCWSTAGVHPHDSSQWSPASEDAIIALANQPEVVAIGECGLDFNRNFSTPQEQERAFQAQLQIAAELQMPIFMHCRDAHERFLALLDPWLDSLPGAILHCFTGSRQQMQACVDRGLYIGITGWVCDERRDLTPKPTSRRNEPAYLPHILERIALWRGEDPQWLAAMTDANARTLFEVVF
ncbi:hydrolase TatD [Salmonella enterica subsp. enterica serovar Enteritidis]|uniref:Hydrolase TatD n=1 Tax=Salmonella enteritidis TaxID=149539 RepID=A0A6X6R5U8_SALEN|nr:TatD family hydrolase [Salmonella enterica]EAN9990062.1 hydrolase TatD [Salmonella enterica]EAP6376643.1 hydrolase TatD [Salmonella enterica]EAP9202840.1 hydrolase TatD [Salmonella enterica]EAR7513618.1 hydrolase TatD [Salmonella enterica]EBB8340781.1 hydrolase TatD [Salmonella enterica]